MCNLCGNYDKLKTYSCHVCNELANINSTKELNLLWIKDCPKLKYIKIEDDLYGIYVLKCEEIIYIKKINENKRTLNRLYIKYCPKLMYAPIANRIVYNNEKLSKPYKTCKYITSAKMNKLYNNIYNLWTKYRIEKYSIIKNKINEDIMIKIIEYII